MNSDQLEALLEKLGLPESEDVPLSDKSVALLRGFGLYDEGTDSPEDVEADRKVAE